MANEILIAVKILNMPFFYFLQTTKLKFQHYFSVKKI